jgi:predicted ATPase
MSDSRNKLQSLFVPTHRYQNFGDVIVRMHVQGFRCHESTVVDIGNPITAFCGLNGTGKSTLLQLAACGYQSASDSNDRYYIRDFIVAGILDPDPFARSASVDYGYWQENRTARTLKVFRSESEKRWRGYLAQPKRAAYFAGVGLYLPRIEVRDFVVRNAARVTVEESIPLMESAQSTATRILGCAYDSMADNKVRHGGRLGHVVAVVRGGRPYSEANMGCGEGRVQHLIRQLDLLPEKSLVLLEEPETSLHPSAQYEFGRYLIDVCIQRKHQIFLTTHSEYLLTALPSASRIYIERGPRGRIRVIPGITTAQAVSLMTGGHDKALHVLVEDSVASSVLAEIIRRSDAMFLKTIAIHPSGDTKTIHSIMIALKETGLPVAAVRDAGIVREDGTVDYHARTGKLEHSSFDVRITLPRLGTHIGAAYRSLAAPTTPSA